MEENKQNDLSTYPRMTDERLDELEKEYHECFDGIHGFKPIAFELIAEIRALKATIKQYTTMYVLPYLQNMDKMDMDPALSKMLIQEYHDDKSVGWFEKDGQLVHGVIPIEQRTNRTNRTN